jgi:hypothetical protein
MLANLRIRPIEVSGVPSPQLISDEPISSLREKIVVCWENFSSR